MPDRGPLKRRLSLCIALLTAQAAFCANFSDLNAQTIPSSSTQSDFSRSSAEKIFAEQNVKNVSVARDGKIVGGGVSVYQHLGGTMIPLGAVSYTLNWDFSIDQANRTATGRNPDTQEKVTVIPSLRSLIVNGKSFQLNESQILYYNDDIYLDLNVFRKELGIQLRYETAESLLDYTISAEAAGALPLVSSPKPAPPATPLATAPAPVSQAKPVETVTQSAPAGKYEGMTDAGDILVLQLVINNITMVEFIDARVIGDKVYLPFSTLCELLEFPIQTDLQANRSEGWFIREENVFIFDGTSVRVHGNNFNLAQNQVIKDDQDFYFEKSLIEEWFPLAFDINQQRLELRIETKQTLPFEDRMKRDQLYAAMEKKKKQKEKERNFEELPIPYKPYSVPFFDVNIGSNYQRSAEPRLRSPYNVQAAGELGYMTTRMYLSGDLSESAIGDFRINSGRDDVDGELLGPLGATSFRIGDINAIGISQATQMTEGRGVTVTNRALDRTDRFDVTNFIGDSTPGWDVELYRNNTLIDAQKIGNDGKYQFVDVPILFGNNTFRLVFLGPQGQLEEVVKNINASSSILEKNDFTYNFSVDQKSKALVDFRDASPNHPDGTRIAGEFEYGISKWLTASLGGAQTVIQDGEHRYVTAGLRTSFLGLLTSWDNAYDFEDKSYSVRVVNFANYLDTNIRLSNKFADKFVSEEDTSIDNLVKRQTDLDLDRTISIPLIGEVSTGLTYQRKVFEQKNRETTWRHRLNKSFLGINVTNALEYVYNSFDDKRAKGTLSGRKIWEENMLSLTADYNIYPTEEMDRLKFSYVRNFTNDIVNNITLTRQFGDNREYEVENTITFDLKDYKLFFTGRADTTDDYYLGVGLNLSLGRFPGNKWTTSSRNMSETGIIVARPFLDENYNLLFDEGEKAATNIPMRLGSRTYSSGENGLSVATNQPVNVDTRIYADADQFSDPNLGPGVEGYSLNLRPGRVATVDYPIFETSEIEGSVHFPEGVTIPRNIQIALVNTEGQAVSITKMEFDGYFLFRGVLPGVFYIRLPYDFLNNRLLEYADNMPVIVKEAGFITRDVAVRSRLRTEPIPQ